MLTQKSPLFLAFPANAIAAPLQKLQDRLALPGPRTPRHQLHLTLRFLGKLNNSQLNSLLKQLPRMQLPQCQLTLNQLGGFTRSKTVWIGPKHIPESLMSFYQDLNNRCGSLKLAPPHKAYRPHITLFRPHNLAELSALPAITPISYHLTQLALYRSIPSAQGSDYEILESWALNEQTSD
ncbi:MAG: RNA 2',3'-cyclic phosphodiesterase [Oceanisphaera sp.]